ncbi:right-handed parallel beta-helix repeat-containing protein [Peribacillus sp. SCS-155]|uniref:right-handed parallel beta-helix repeat-containing protein n=1 Tax=Peribacillus sedimenti TaxID=3115297 RepID=UPI0039061972
MKNMRKKKYRFLLPIALCLALLSFAIPYDQVVNAADINITKTGAIPNDGKLDTNAIQRAIDDVASSGGGIVDIPAGTYDVAVDTDGTALTMKSNVHIRLAEDSVIELRPNDQGIYRMFFLGDVDNVAFSGGTLVGDRSAHEGTDGEWGHGIQIYGHATNVEISRMTFKNFWGDGIEISSRDSNVPDGVKINRITADNNRRQGLSIVAGRNIQVTNSVFKNTNGTPPSAGIDLERDPPYDKRLENVTITNNVLENNEGYGLAFVYVDSHTIHASGNKIRNNKEGGVFLGNANKTTVRDNVISGNGSKIKDDATQNFGSGVFLNYSSENTIAGNDIDQNYRYGIHALNGVNDNVFKENKITNNKSEAIKLYGDANTRIIDNQISGNGNEHTGADHSLTNGSIKLEYIILAIALICLGAGAFTLKTNKRIGYGMIVFSIFMILVSGLLVTGMVDPFSTISR